MRCNVTVIKYSLKLQCLTCSCYILCTCINYIFIHMYEYHVYEYIICMFACIYNIYPCNYVCLYICISMYIYIYI